MIHGDDFLLAGHCVLNEGSKESIFFGNRIQTISILFLFDISNSRPVFRTTVETWKEFEANELTHSAAHHLLAIHELGAEYGGWARVSDIAHELGITRGSVSINLRALKKRGYVATDEHRMVKLSPKGTEIIQAIKTKKTLFKLFLTDVLGVSEHQAEIDSCKIEHLISHETSERLAQYVEQFKHFQLTHSR
jgi:Mn-dependent DtxR family transcriptional regulator